MADYLEKNTKEILEANSEDYKRAEKKGIPKALLSRLKLTKEKFNSGIDGVRKVGDLADPVDQVRLASIKISQTENQNRIKALNLWLII